MSKEKEGYQNKYWLYKTMKWLVWEAILKRWSKNTRQQWHRSSSNLKHPKTEKGETDSSLTFQLSYACSKDSG